MNIKERLEQAYRNVSFESDQTWSNDLYRKTNLRLCQAEKLLQQTKLSTLRPRTVRECIPNSRLAQYSNYLYNESRELSYASNTSNYSYNLSLRDENGEVWELPEVDDLFKWFLEKDVAHSPVEINYESPLMNANNFEERVLKLGLQQGTIKNIWNTENDFNAKADDLVLSIYLSPLDNFFIKETQPPTKDVEWFKKVSLTNDFEQLKNLSKSIKEQTKWLSQLTNTSNVCLQGSTCPDISYSEVLQGLLPSRKALNKKNVPANLVDDNVERRIDSGHCLKTLPHPCRNCVQEYFYPTFQVAPKAQRWILLPHHQLYADAVPPGASINEETASKVVESFNNSKETEDDEENLADKIVDLVFKLMK